MLRIEEEFDAWYSALMAGPRHRADEIYGALCSCGLANIRQCADQQDTVRAFIGLADEGVEGNEIVKRLTGNTVAAKALPTKTIAPKISKPATKPESVYDCENTEPSIKAALTKAVKDHPGQTAKRIVDMLSGCHVGNAHRIFGLMRAAGEFRTERTRGKVGIVEYIYPRAQSPRMYKGLLLSTRELAAHPDNMHNLCQQQIAERIKSGMSAEEALTTAKRKPGPQAGPKRKNK